VLRSFPASFCCCYPAVALAISAAFYAYSSSSAGAAEAASLPFHFCPVYEQASEGETCLKITHNLFTINKMMNK